MEKPGSVLTDDELRDHFADLLENLCNQLEEPLTDASELSALKHAETHGDSRWVQCYRLPELLREIAALRTVLVAAVVEHGHACFSLHEQSFANIIVHRFFDALVVESATLFASLREESAVLQQRQQLAQELHDSACQTLQGAVLEIAVLRQKLDAPAADELNIIAKTIHRGVEDVRTIVHGLVAAVRKFEHGLPAALEELGVEISRVVDCDVRCDRNLNIPTKQAFQLFRIAQEAAGNACKHSRPKSVFTTLGERPDAFELTVADDGCGFDTAKRGSSGMGLYSLQQRARAIDVLLNIESEPGTGTKITCILPKSAVLVRESSALNPERVLAHSRAV